MVSGVQRVEGCSGFDAEGRTGAWRRGRRRAGGVVGCEVLMTASARRVVGKGVRCSGVDTVASRTDLGEDSDPCSLTRSCCRWLEGNRFDLGSATWSCLFFHIRAGTGDVHCGAYDCGEICSLRRSSVQPLGFFFQLFLANQRVGQSLPADTRAWHGPVGVANSSSTEKRQRRREEMDRKTSTDEQRSS